MAFDWMSPVHARRPNGGAARRAMYLRELEERAALLHRLRYSREATTARLTANVRWDFGAGAPEPDLTREIEGIVDRLFSRANRRGDDSPRNV